MTNPVSGNATGLPSRRRVLATLAGVSAAVTLPMAASAALPAENPDAALIALAARVETLTARELAASERYFNANRAADSFISKRPKPFNEDEFSNPSSMEETSDGTRIIRIPPASAYAARNAARAEHDVAVEAWEAECEAIRAKHGEPAAQKLWGRTQRRLIRAARGLDAMPATTREGVTAKARASLTVLAATYGEEAEIWMSELMTSTLRDVVAIGAAA